MDQFRTSLFDHFTGEKISVTPLAFVTRAVVNALKDLELDDSDPIVGELRELIETRIRPAATQGGGDIVLRGYKEGIVYLQLKGSCAGCPSATQTLKNGIENLLKNKIPEVTKVEQVL